MDIQAITEEIIQTANTTFNIIKDAALWSGHMVKIGFTNYIIPAVKTIWSMTSNRISEFTSRIKTGPGVAFAFSGGLLLAGIAAFKIADRKAYEEDLVSKTAWKAIGIAAFVTATVVTSFGIAAIIIV